MGSIVYKTPPHIPKAHTDDTPTPTNKADAINRSLQDIKTADWVGVRMGKTLSQQNTLSFYRGRALKRVRMVGKRAGNARAGTDLNPNKCVRALYTMK